MACCLTAPSHYLNQCWLINTIPWHSSEGNFTGNTQDTYIWFQVWKISNLKFQLHPPRTNGSTHWGRVTHICVTDLTSIGSDNGLSPGRRQAIIRTNAGILLIRPLGTNFSEILVEVLIFLFKKMRLKVSSAKRRPFCLGLNELMCYPCTCLWLSHHIHNFGTSSLHFSWFLWHITNTWHWERWWKKALYINLIVIHFMSPTWNNRIMSKMQLQCYKLLQKPLSVHEPSQWEMTLQCYVVSHWLGAFNGIVYGRSRHGLVITPHVLL